MKCCVSDCNRTAKVKNVYNEFSNSGVIYEEQICVLCKEHWEQWNNDENLSHGLKESHLL